MIQQQGEYVSVGFSASEGTAFCVGKLSSAVDHQTKDTLDKVWRLNEVPRALTSGKLARCGFVLTEGIFFVTSDIHWWAPLQKRTEGK